MGVAIDITDAVVTLLEGETFAVAADVERALVPYVVKTDLTQPLIQVCWVGKASHEYDRHNEALFYTVAVGIHQPLSDTENATQQDTAINLVEEVHDYLAFKSNRSLSLAGGGEAKLQLPFTTEQIYNPDEVRQTGNFFTVANFKYRYYKGRS